jgi:hypothetical protein
VTWNDVEIEEESFDGMIREEKTAKVVSSVDSVYIVRESTL